jgi:hypothetical protein
MAYKAHDSEFIFFNKKASFIDEEYVANNTRQYKYSLNRKNIKSKHWRSLPLCSAPSIFSKEGWGLIGIALLFQIFAGACVFGISYAFLPLEISIKIGVLSFFAGFVLLMASYGFCNIKQHKKAYGGWSAKEKTSVEKLFLPPGCSFGKKTTKSEAVVCFECREFKSCKACFNGGTSQIEADKKLKKIAHVASSGC